jgi:hypothetical protein
MSYRVRIVLAWAALLGALLGALAPTVTRVLGSARGVQLALAETCSARVNRIQGDAPSGAHNWGESCPFCFSHALTPVPPATPVQWMARTGGTYALNPMSGDLPDTAQTWSRAHSRAPPALS